MGESERASGAARLGLGCGVALLVSAAAELTVYLSPLLRFRGESFFDGLNTGQNPLQLVFAAALGLLGLSAVLRRGLPALALCLVVPSLAVAAAEGGFNFYEAIRELHSFSHIGGPSPRTTIGTWAALVISLVGAVLVLRALPTIRRMSTFRFDAPAAFGTVLCAVALVGAFVLNRYAVVVSGRVEQRFGGLFSGLSSGARGLDEIAIVVHGGTVLVAVAGGVLLAGAFGRSRAASLLLLSSAFGATLVEGFWLTGRGPYFSFLPAFWLLVAGAVAAVLLAIWCWLGEQHVRPPAPVPDAATLTG